MLLWDVAKRSYSYFIETSPDQINWDRAVDYTGYHCRSWQILHFSSRPVRYIKLVGTHNTVNREFHVVALEAYHTAMVPNLLNGLIFPVYNVATPNNGATVIKGIAPDELLNGDVKNYDLNTGYTWHFRGIKENPCDE